MAGWFAQGLCWVAGWCARLPGATVTWPVDPAALVTLGVACLGFVLVLPAVWARRWVTVAVIVVLLLVVIRPPSQTGWPPASWQLVSCDVGQGDATVLNASPPEGPPGQAVLVDTGPEPDALDACLTSLGVTRVVLLVLTHLHADHVGGLAAVQQHGRALGAVLTSDATSPTAAWADVLRLTDGVPHSVAAPDSTVRVGAVTLDVISVKPLTDTTRASDGESSDENDSSLVLRAHVGQLDVVLGGDVEEAGQSAAVSTGRDLTADVVLIPHHGSAHQARAFLQATHASVALISVGLDNSYGHPAPSLLRLVNELGMRVFRTDLNGAIAVGFDDSALRVTVQRQPP